MNFFPRKSTDFIRDYGLRLGSVNSYFESSFRNPRDVIAVADVHTDLNSGTVLEEAIGYLKVLLVAFKLPDGKISIGAGPVTMNLNKQYTTG